MSIKFFRKRRKLIIGIMVVLMFSFLASFQGINYFAQTKASRLVIGEGDFGDITQQDVTDAGVAYGAIRMLAGAMQTAATQEQAYVLAAISSNKSEQDVSLAYALLLQEAAAKDINVSSGEIDAAITSYRRGNFDYTRFVDTLKIRHSMSDGDIREILEGWLRIVKSFQSGAKIYSPSKAELEKLYADIKEKMSVKLVMVEAKDYTAKLPQPTKEQIAKQFEEYKGKTAGKFVAVDKPTFGYIIPPKVDVAWLMVRYNPVLATGKTSMAKMREYYSKNKESFIEKEEKGKKTYKPFAKVQREVFDATLFASAGKEMQTVITNVQANIRKNMAVGSKEQQMADVYKAVNAELLAPADDILARKIPIIVVENQPLFVAIEQIAQMAQPRIDSIAMPFISTGNVDVDPMKKVSFKAQNITVGEALKKLFKDNRISAMEKVSWKTWGIIDNTIFPSNMLPMVGGKTGMVTALDIVKNPILGKAVSYQYRAMLVQMAITVEELEPRNTKFKVNQPGPQMMCSSQENPGIIFWVVSGVEQSRIPEKLTPEIAKKAAEDIKLTKGLKLAAKAAEAVKTPAELDKFIKQGKGREVVIKPFSRIQIIRSPYGGEQFDSVKLPIMRFGNEVVDTYFITQAFKQLAPESLEVGKYAKASNNLMHLTLPCEGYAVVGQRIDYMPALAKDFATEAKKYQSALDANQKIDNLKKWFNYKDIAARCDFKLTVDGEEETGK